MDVSRRRQELGGFASAALPVIWGALERKRWSHSDFARELKIRHGSAARILYGDRGVGRKMAALIDEVLALKLGVLWDQPCPPTWKPHQAERPRNRRARRAQARTQQHLSTGTDG